MHAWAQVAAVIMISDIRACLCVCQMLKSGPLSASACDWIPPEKRLTMVFSLRTSKCEVHNVWGSTGATLIMALIIRVAVHME